jgi:hypothetical protein
MRNRLSIELVDLDNGPGIYAYVSITCVELIPAFIFALNPVPVLSKHLVDKKQNTEK